MVTFDDVREAAARVAPVVVRTPLLGWAALDELVGARILLKAENLQRTGSFKIRGAYNFLKQLSPEQTKSGVVAFSSGNHAQAVAAAGTLLGIRTTIVMPEDAPQIKIDNTRKLGGEVVLYDRYTADRAVIAAEIAAESGAELVPSYDHPWIIAGQGTCGIEIAEQCAELGITADRVYVNCSGGGLTAGVALAMDELSPVTRVNPVEPEQFDDTARSLESGERELNDPDARTICDALMVSPPGEITFAINNDLVGRGLSVSDDEVRDAMRYAFRQLKLVVEPGGAASLAAVLAGKIDVRGKTVVAVLSGGNVDAELFARTVTAAD